MIRSDVESEIDNKKMTEKSEHYIRETRNHEYFRKIYSRAL